VTESHSWVSNSAPHSTHTTQPGSPEGSWGEDAWPLPRSLPGEPPRCCGPSLKGQRGLTSLRSQRSSGRGFKNKQSTQVAVFKKSQDHRVLNP
jgi:hypothetical protein